MKGKSRSCAEQNAQAEAGPLMLMVRRANMGLSIAANRENRKAPTGRVSAWTRPGRGSRDGYARADIACDDAAGADNGAVADRDAGQDDGAATDPDVAADPHGAAEFEPLTAGLGVARVIPPADLDGRGGLGAVAQCVLRL